MARVVPVLGSAGFATDLTIKADQAMSNFYISQRSQSDQYRGSIASLGEIISRHGNNVLTVDRELRNVLESYLARQFDEVDLTVTTIDKSTSIEIQIVAILRDGNKSIDIHHVVASSDSKIRSIIDLQNQGKPIILADS